MTSLRFLYMLLLAVVAALLTVCQPASTGIDRSALLGSWQVDSVYRHYNQFSQMEPEPVDPPTYHYLPGEKVREQKGKDYQEYLCQWREPDTLLYLAPEGDTIGMYQVLRLTEKHMVLKRPQPLIFPGPGQDRYEIRYFSRMEPETAAAAP